MMMAIIAMMWWHWMEERKRWLTYCSPIVCVPIVFVDECDDGGGDDALTAEIHIPDVHFRRRSKHVVGIVLRTHIKRSKVDSDRWWTVFERLESHDVPIAVTRCCNDQPKYSMVKYREWMWCIVMSGGSSSIYWWVKSVVRRQKSTRVLSVRRRVEKGCAYCTSSFRHAIASSSANSSGLFSVSVIQFDSIQFEDMLMMM